MVKWYNESLPRISREFDSLWPHIKKSPIWGFFNVRPEAKLYKIKRFAESKPD